MSGLRGGDTGGNYLEHCSGFAWSISEGAFGLDFNSDAEAAATVTPRFSADWPRAHARFRLRGVEGEMVYERDLAKGVTLRAVPTPAPASPAPAPVATPAAAPVRVRLVWNGEIHIVELRSPALAS